MKFDKYTIRQFFNAKYNDDYSVLSKEDLDEVNSEFIDAAGLFESEEFKKVGYIHYLNGRVNSIKMAIRLQKDFLKEFGVPYVDDFERFKHFGHILFWDGKPEEFLKALSRIESKEKKYITQLEISIKELIDLRKNKKKSEEMTRKDFILLIFSLGKEGWNIDQDNTTVEQLAYIVKSQIEKNKT